MQSVGQSGMYLGCASFFPQGQKMGETKNSNMHSTVMSAHISGPWTASEELKLLHSLTDCVCKHSLIHFGRDKLFLLHSSTDPTPLLLGLWLLLLLVAQMCFMWSCFLSMQS